MAQPARELPPHLQEMLARAGEHDHHHDHSHGDGVDSSHGHGDAGDHAGGHHPNKQNRSHGHDHGHGDAGGHDHGHGVRTEQAGQGRGVELNPVSGDDGSADPGLLDALTRFHAAGGSAGAGGPLEVVEAFRVARLLVALVPHETQAGADSDGKPGASTQEISTVMVQAPDGRKALPAFTSVDTLRAWNPKARPVPVAGPEVAHAAVQEDTELIVIDPTSPTEFVLRRPVVAALATKHSWVPPWLSADITSAFDASISGEPAVVGVRLEPGDPSGRLVGPELAVVLGVRPGLDADAVRALVERLSERWSRESSIASGVDSLTVRLLAA